MGAPAGRLSVDTGRAPRGLILLQSAADGHRPRECQRPRIRGIKLSAMPTNPTERSEGARRVGLPALLMPFPFLSHVPRPRPWPRTRTARVSGETLCTPINRTVRYRPRSGVRTVGFSLVIATDWRTAVPTAVAPSYGLGFFASARHERVTVRLFSHCCNLSPGHRRCRRDLLFVVAVPVPLLCRTAPEAGPARRCPVIAGTGCPPRHELAAHRAAGVVDVGA